MRDKAFWIFFTTLLVIGCIILIVYLEWLARDDAYKQCLNNLPTNEKIITDLETILISENINIVSRELSGNNLTYTVEASNYYNYQIYKVLYKPQHKSSFGLPYYEWEYISHIYIIAN